MNNITNEMMKEFSETYKVGLLGTIGDGGYPHISLISSLQALNEKQMISGQFITGLSSKYVEANKKRVFYNVSGKKNGGMAGQYGKKRKLMAKNMKCIIIFQCFVITHNFGIHTVHYYDLVDVSKGHNLDMGE